MPYDAHSFDLRSFVSSLDGAAAPDQRRLLVFEEISRVSGLDIHDDLKRFNQQMYVGRLKRLLRFLDGEDVTRDLTPTERGLFSALDGTAAEA